MDLGFFRELYQIPKNTEIDWCILVERSPKGENARLGIRLLAYDKVIDVAARQIVQLGLPTSTYYSAYPAKREVEGDEVVFTGSGYMFRVPETYASDIYYRTVYSDELMKDTLI